MKPKNQLIGGRYQYNPLLPTRQTPLYNEYRCYDKVTKRDLTLHLLPGDQRLIQTMRDVKHPLTLLVFDAVQTEDGGLAVLFEGGGVASLGEVMENTGHLTEEDALVIAKHLLVGLRHLHEKLIVYGRLCIQNVLLFNAGMIKLGFNVYEEQVPLPYRSPEALRGESVTNSSDIYAVGVILYKLVYGVLPFTGNSEKEVLKKIKGKDYNEQYKETHSPFVIVVSKEVEYLLESMLEYHPENRPTMEQLMSNLALNFPIQTDFNAYLKPKVNLLPQPFYKKYLIYRASRKVISYGEYFNQTSYLALSTAQKKMVTIYCPELRMFETPARKVESYFEKLNAIKEGFN